MVASVIRIKSDRVADRPLLDRRRASTRGKGGGGGGMLRRETEGVVEGETQEVKTQIELPSQTNGLARGGSWKGGGRKGRQAHTCLPTVYNSPLPLLSFPPRPYPLLDALSQNPPSFSLLTTVFVSWMILYAIDRFFFLLFFRPTHGDDTRLEERSVRGTQRVARSEVEHRWFEGFLLQHAFTYLRARVEKVRRTHWLGHIWRDLEDRNERYGKYTGRPISRKAILLLWFREKINYRVEKGFRVVCKRFVDDSMIIYLFQNSWNILFVLLMNK